MVTNLIWISCFLLGFSLHFGEAIRCWECNSKYDPNCGEPFKPHTMALSDCSQRFLPQDQTIESTICRKLTQKVSGETRIIRSCGYLDPQEAGTCSYKAGTHLVFVEYCQCAGDGCNRAGYSAQPPFLATVLLIAIACFLS